MAGQIEWLDGFDTYSNADIPRNYPLQGGVIINTTAGNCRTGPQSLQCTGGNGVVGVAQVLPLQPIRTIGMAINPTNQTVNGLCAMYLGNGVANIGNMLGGGVGNGDGVQVRQQAGGFLQLYMSKANVQSLLYTSPSPVFISGNFTFVEMTLNVTAGTVGVWVNGTNNLVNVSSLGLTLNSIHAAWGGQSGSNGDQNYIEDIYVRKDAVRLGAHRCYPLFVNGDLAPQTFTLSSGGVANTLINQPQYNLANYIAGTAVGNEANFNCQDLVVANAIINGVRLNSVQLLDIAGSAGGQVQAIIGAGTYTGATSNPSTSPTYQNDLFDLGSASVTDINNMTLNVQRLS